MCELQDPKMRELAASMVNNTRKLVLQWRGIFSGASTASARASAFVDMGVMRRVAFGKVYVVEIVH